MPLAALRRTLWSSLPTLRIRSVNRLTLDRELLREFRRLKPGIVLDVGAKGAPYREHVPATRYLRLDIDPRKAPDICCDVHEFSGHDQMFDTILAIEVLEHLRDPQRAIDRIFDALKPGGVCILSTRFMYRYHPDPEDHYRFTSDSLKYLFRRFERVEVHPHGGRPHVLWEIINAGGRTRVFLNVLNPLIARLPARGTKFPLGFVVYAERSRAGSSSS
jgi:SAM-dependent methyltransferase